MNLSNYGIAEGRLTRNPVILNNKDGSRKVKFTLAVRDTFKNADGTKSSQFVSLEAFIRAGRETNGVYDMIHKGDLVKVRYTVKSSAYTDKDGNDVFCQSLLIQELQFGESKATTDARAANAHSCIKEDFPF